MSIDTAQSISHRPPAFPLGPSVVLPTELYQTLNYVHLLHSLAVNPKSILPPGKSLLSVLSRPYAQGDPQNSALRERVQTLVHKAFWDQTLELLSDPTPSVQLSRLKELLTDIRTALLPLLPEKHHVLETLALPLPPTSNLLRSLLDPLREVVQALRSRCAPVHDGQLEDLLQLLEDPLDSSLPTTIVDASRSILQLCEQMKEDLAQFVLGTMGEAQLHEAVVEEAIIREREFVQRLWGSKRLRELWGSWLADGPPPAPSTAMASKERFVRRLVHALGTNQPISCTLPTTTMSVDSLDDDEPLVEEQPPPASSNYLPPPLLFVTPTLLYLQNYLQALVITAALRALVKIPPRPSLTNTATDASASPEHSFEERVWMLLKSDIDAEPSADGPKLINLADEVIRASHICKDDVIDNAEESRLRAAVDRTLQPNDPVFMLLQKRLIQAIQARLLLSPPAPDTRESSPVPRYLQSGRRAPGGAARTPKRFVDAKAPDGETESARLVIKGFDHPVMVDAVTEALSLLQGCIGWTEREWHDLFSVEY